MEGFGSIFVLFPTLLLGSSSYSPDFFRDLTGGLSHWLFLRLPNHQITFAAAWNPAEEVLAEPEHKSKISLAQSSALAQIICCPKPSTSLGT